MGVHNSDQDELGKKGHSSANIERVTALQAPLDRMIFHPLAARLAQALVSTPVTPNMISVSGGIMIVLAGAAYVQDGALAFAILGSLLHMSWHVLDGADGDLARLTGRSNPTGEIVDGICDYLGHFLLYAILAGAMFASEGWLIWALGTAAGLSRVIQASFHEAQRRQFLHWVYQVEWLRTAQGGPTNFLSGLGRTYLGIVDRLAPADTQIDVAMADPVNGERLRAKLRLMGVAAIAGNGLLGATYRTIALGASMLAGSPMWYFLYELVILNLALVHGVWRSRQTLTIIRAEIYESANTPR